MPTTQQNKAGEQNLLLVGAIWLVIAGCFAFLATALAAGL